MPCPKCGSTSVSYIMLGPTGYMLCNKCEHAYGFPPVQYNQPKDEDEEIMRCPNCQASLRRFMFSYDAEGDLMEKYLDCPKCGKHHTKTNEEANELIDKYAGFHTEEVAYALVSENEGQMLLGYVKAHPEMYGPNKKPYGTISGGGYKPNPKGKFTQSVEKGKKEPKGHPKWMPWR